MSFCITVVTQTEAQMAEKTFQKDDFKQVL